MADRSLSFPGQRSKRPRSDELKVDNARRPLWIIEDKTILLETSSEFYKQAYDFCIAIAEPESRLENFHEYKITAASLYGAVSAGMPPQDIVKYLDFLSKTHVPDSIRRFIKDCTENVGKLKLGLKDGKFIIEGIPSAIDRVYSRISHAVLEKKQISNTHAVLEMNPSKVVEARATCRTINYPLVEEYDYKNDTGCPTLDIKLDKKAQLRPYQMKSVDKMFVNGKARSGVIVLPCGAGKSLTGVYAAVRLGKPVLCFANTSVSVEQWAFQFETWTNLHASKVQSVTSDTKSKDFNAKADIIVTTYSMYGYTGQRSKDSEAIMNAIEGREWGLILMDEVHVVPAKNFREAVAKTKSHCKLGLTATLLREDDAIDDLEFIIGPKLYEANWQDLVQAGYLAKVTCFEVLCPMTKDFLREYLDLFLHGSNNWHGREEKRSVQHTLYGVNPMKLMACEYLIKYHEAQKDKIIVFSDNLFALEKMGMVLNKPMIKGETSHEERLLVLKRFRTEDKGYTVFLSKVGDTSIDLPEATVVIQISSQGASRRQEAQRLGRILRPKIRNEQGMLSGGTAIFYSLVSQDTAEMLYATKRQKFLVNQGYTFNTLTNFPPPEGRGDLIFARPEVQAQLLKEALQDKSVEEVPKEQPKKRKPDAGRHDLFRKRYQKH